MLHQLCLVKNNPFSWVSPPRMLQQLSLILLVKNNPFSWVNPPRMLQQLSLILLVKNNHFSWVKSKEVAANKKKNAFMLFLLSHVKCDVSSCCHDIFSTRAGSGGVASTHFQHTDRQGNHAERCITTILKFSLSVPDFVS